MLVGCAPDQRDAQPAEQQRDQDGLAHAERCLLDEQDEPDAQDDEGGQLAEITLPWSPPTSAFTRARCRSNAGRNVLFALRLVERREDPQRQVEHQPEPVQRSQQREAQPDGERLQAEVMGKAGRHTADQSAIGPSTELSRPDRVA